ncbi:Ada metal-binding domain-containing protein [Streptosporangium sp. V21-05]|uniref:Ada metal-binding domain-containing protein n=1 Tax=Streptosporangium sp. V21-05 TaxID=3446115 RepID=UPI003F52EBBC
MRPAAPIARGGYVNSRVFFADEETALAAGYRPCGRCLPAEYQEWKHRHPSAACADPDGGARRPGRAAIAVIKASGLIPAMRDRGRGAAGRTAGREGAGRPAPGSVVFSRGRRGRRRRRRAGGRRR